MCRKQYTDLNINNTVLQFILIKIHLNVKGNPSGEGLALKLN